MGLERHHLSAAISGISPSLYESAQIDGAGRLKRIWHITLPSIRGTNSVLLILAIGGLFSANFDQAMLLAMTSTSAQRDHRGVRLQNRSKPGRYSYAGPRRAVQSVISSSCRRRQQREQKSCPERACLKGA
jgi:putative aldouronate transport system permease protein